MVSDPNLLSEFATESLEHLETAEPLLLEMEKRARATLAAQRDLPRDPQHQGRGRLPRAREHLGPVARARSLLMRLRDGELTSGPRWPTALRGIDALRRMSALPTARRRRRHPDRVAHALVERAARAGGGGRRRARPVRGGLLRAAPQGPSPGPRAAAGAQRDHEKLLAARALRRAGQRARREEERRVRLGAGARPLRRGGGSHRGRAARAPSAIEGAVDEFPLPDNGARSSSSARSRSTSGS